MLARLDYLGCPGRNGGEGDAATLRVAHFPPLGSTSSPFTQFIFISVVFVHPSSSLSSPRSLAAFPLSHPHGLPTTRDYFFLKKISPRFRPHLLVEGKGIVKIRLSLNELVAVERVAKPNFGSHVREREWNEKREGEYKGYKGGRG